MLVAQAVRRAFGRPVLPFLALVAACGPAELPAQAIRSERAAFSVVEIARGLDHPWSIAFLPDGALLVTEREGRLRLIRGGRLDPRPISGVPPVVASGQGGLFDVALHPRFAANRTVFLAFAARRDDGVHTRLVRASLDLDAMTLGGVTTIFDARPGASGGRHFGGRIVFDRAGLLYLSVGERGDMERAQRLDDHSGSVIRLHEDGSVPPDNPFVGHAGARPEIFTFGHRNPQGMARHPATGAIWTHEHAARGGDEINVLRAGRNYGWPAIGYGTHYSGARVGVGTAAPGMEQPLHYWVPSIAPSGMAFYEGDAFPGWRGNLFVGALAGETLVRLALDGEKVVREERLLTDTLGRIRDVRAGPDGFLYIATDASDGRVVRLEPVR